MSSAYPSPSRRRGVRAALPTITVTAVVTFVLTSLGQYLFERTADQVVTRATPDLAIDIRSRTSGRPYEVIVPPGEGVGPAIPMDPVSAVDWAEKQGGAAAGSVVVEVMVWGRKDEPITVEGFTVEDRSCSPAPAWTTVTYDAHYAVVPVRNVSFDLDANPAVVVVEADAEHPDWGFPFSVSSQQPERFRLLASTRKQDCRFVFGLTYRHAGKTGTAQVGTGEQPFRVVSSAAATQVRHWAAKTSDTLTIRD